jgi:hypothetical protein
MDEQETTKFNVEEVKASEPVEALPETPPDLLSIIKDLPDAPSQVTIDGWKAKYGNVFVSGFSETEVYIWRAINRAEYKKMQIAQQIEAATIQLGENPSKEEVATKVSSAVDAEFDREDQMVSQCLLWPKLTPEELSVKAGTVPSLMEQISQNSNFLTAQQASILVMRL